MMIADLIDNNKVVFDGIFIQSAKIIIDNISDPTKELKMNEWLKEKHNIDYSYELQIIA